MRIWRFWWRTLVYNPPIFIELLMTALAFFFVALWNTTNCWPYLVLSFSYVMGACMSTLVREMITTSPQPRMTYLISGLLLLSLPILIILYGLFCFMELAPLLTHSH